MFAGEDDTTRPRRQGSHFISQQSHFAKGNNESSLFPEINQALHGGFTYVGT
jgi:hypothetical protein